MDTGQRYYADDEEVKVPLMEAAYKDEPDIQGSADPSTGPLPLPLAASDPDSQHRPEPAGAQRLTRSKRLHRIGAFVSLFVFLIIVTDKAHLLVDGAWRLFSGSGGRDIGFVKDGEGRYKIPVPDGVSLGRCTKWDGKDADGSEGEGIGISEADLGYEPDGDGSYWIRPRAKPQSTKAPVSAVKGPIMIQVINPLGPHPVTSTANFNVSLSNYMLFLARGSLASGKVRVVQSEDRVGDEVEVKVDVTTIDCEGKRKCGPGHDELLEMVRVCKVKREGYEEGVGIFAPQWARHASCPGRRGGRHGNGQPRFDVTIELPRWRYKGAPDDESLKAMHLETDMPLFEHSVGVTREKVVFRDFLAKSANMAIDAYDLSAEKIEISSQNAPITGHYSTWGSVKLTTENAPIEVDLTLWNTPASEGEPEVGATSAVLSTKNAPIVVKSELSSPGTEDKSGGKFNLTVTTRNSPIKLSFPTAPLHSNLQLTADTALAPIEAHMHPTFEGDYFLKSVLMDVELSMSPDEQDPEGKDRKRSVMSSMMRAHDQGVTWWGDFPMERKEWWGNVTIKTSFASAKMYFNGPPEDN